MQNFKEIKNLINQFGFFYTLKLAFRYLSLTALNSIMKLLRIKIYSTITFPMTNIKIKVKFQNFYWKRLEKGLWEINCIKKILALIKEKQVIFDIGAWVGPYTLLISKLVGISGMVYTFEPDPIAFKELCENIEINDLKNIHAEKIGLSNEVGSAKFRLNRGGGTSGSSLLKTNQYISSKEEIITLTTIDKYCEESNVYPDGLIIDVEGAEGLVIEGSKNLISKKSPWILMEFHGGFMSEEQRIYTWQEITKTAKKVIYIDGESTNYSYGDLLEIMPDCTDFHLFIQY